MIQSMENQQRRLRLQFGLKKISIYKLEYNGFGMPLGSIFIFIFCNSNFVQRFVPKQALPAGINQSQVSF